MENKRKGRRRGEEGEEEERVRNGFDGSRGNSNGGELG